MTFYSSLLYRSVNQKYCSVIEICETLNQKASCISRYCKSLDEFGVLLELYVSRLRILFVEQGLSGETLPNSL